MGLKVFIDDVRDKPDVYDIKTDSLKEFLGLLLNKDVDVVSFDHDLENKPFDGYDMAHIARLLVEEGEVGPFDWYVHSANYVGRQRIEQELNRGW